MPGAGAVLVSPASLPSHGPHQAGPTSWPGPVPVPVPRERPAFLLPDVNLMFICSTLVAEAVNTRIALQFATEVSAYKTSRGRVAEAFGYQKLQCGHK